MTPELLRAKIDAIKNATVPLSVSPQELGEVLEALMETPGESTTSLQEVLEFETFGEFPTEGVANTIYIDKSDDKMYCWSGTEYVILNDSGTTITIRSLAALDDKLTNGVFTVLRIRTINNKKVVISYTLRVESAPGVINQYLENVDGYQWRTYATSTNTWFDWTVVTFATTAYVDEALSGIANLLSEV